MQRVTTHDSPGGRCQWLKIDSPAESRDSRVETQDSILPLPCLIGPIGPFLYTSGLLQKDIGTSAAQVQLPKKAFAQRIRARIFAITHTHLKKIAWDTTPLPGYYQYRTNNHTYDKYSHNMKRNVGISLTLIFLATAVAQVSSGEWLEWLTCNKLTTTQAAFVITGVVAHQGARAWVLWDKCYKHSTGERVDAYACATDIGTMFLQWGIGLTGLGALTGWYKRDEHGIAMLGNPPLLIIDDYNIGTRRTKRDDITPITFTIGNETYLHDSSVYNYVETQDYSLALIGHSDLDGAMGNYSLPLAILESTSSGLVLSPVAPEEISKRDGVENSLFVSGQGSAVFECQYGGGSGGYSFIEVYDYVLSFGQTRLCNAEYHAYHGYVGNDSRLKCAWKVYNDDETWGSWRNWDDVWSSF